MFLPGISRKAMKHTYSVYLTTLRGMITVGNRFELPE